MGLFSRKPKARFETITIDRESDVFRALENQGFMLIDQPYQFDVQKPPEKLRKDAMAVAKGLNAELVVEIYDPIYQTMPWKGLRYAAWRKATAEELQERAKQKALKGRPNYKDTMGSYDDITRKLDQKKIHVTEEDLHALDSVVASDNIDTKGDIDGKTAEELKKADDAIQAISTFNPYDHQGESAEEAKQSGPMFMESMDVLSDVPTDDGSAENVDAMALMQEAASDSTNVPPTQPPAVQQPAQMPQNAPQSGVPQNVVPAQPPAVQQPAQMPQNAPQSGVPQNVAPAQPPAVQTPGQVPQTAPQGQVPAAPPQEGLPSAPSSTPPLPPSANRAEPKEGTEQ